MRFPALPRRLITASLLAALVAITHAADPVAGVDFVWVDLGEENEGLLLTQEEQGDGMTEPDDVGGLECRINPWPYAGPGHNHMYFRIDDAYLFATNTEAWIIMEYFDSADAQQIDCQYDSNGAGAVAGAEGAGNRRGDAAAHGARRHHRHQGLDGKDNGEGGKCGDAQLADEPGVGDGDQGLDGHDHDVGRRHAGDERADGSVQKCAQSGVIRALHVASAFLRFLRHRDHGTADYGSGD